MYSNISLGEALNNNKVLVGNWKYENSSFFDRSITETLRSHYSSGNLTNLQLQSGSLSNLKRDREKSIVDSFTDPYCSPRSNDFSVGMVAPIPKTKTVPHFNGVADLRSEFSINSRSAPIYNREPITAVLSPCIRIFSATKTRRISTERISVDNTYKIGKIFTSKTPALPLLNRGARRSLKKERSNSFENNKKGKRKKSSNGSPGSNNSPKSRLAETVIKLDSGIASRLERAANSRENVSLFTNQCNNRHSPDTDFIRTAPATLQSHTVQQLKKSKQKIFFSDGINVLKKGIIGVPPASPTPEHLENVQYVKCLADLRSKRKLDEKLLEIAKFRDEQKKKAVAEEKKARAVEEKKEVAQLRVRQRQEIYALNQVMKELEERRFQQYVKEKTES